MDCSQCNKPVQPEWRLCPNCGAQLGQAAPTSAEPKKTEPKKKTSPLMAGCLALVCLGALGFVGCAAFVISAAKHAGSSDAASGSNVTDKIIPSIGQRQVCTVDGVQYYVAKVNEATSIGESFNLSKADGVYVIVHLVADNTDKTTHEIDTSLITLNDAKGRSYTSSSNGETTLAMGGDANADLILSEVQPSVVKDVDIIYDIPKGDSGLTLTIPHGTFTDGVDGTIALPAPD